MKFTLHGFLEDLLFLSLALALAFMVGCPNRGQNVEALPEAMQQPQQELQTVFSNHRFNDCLLCLKSEGGTTYCIPTRKIMSLQCEEDETRIRLGDSRFVWVSQTCQEIIRLWDRCY